MLNEQVLLFNSPSLSLCIMYIFRRADRQPGDQKDRICSCHFKDGKKEGDPAYFAWNEGKAMDFSDPECTKR